MAASRQAVARSQAAGQATARPLRVRDASAPAGHRLRTARCARNASPKACNASSPSVRPAIRSSTKRIASPTKSWRLRRIPMSALRLSGCSASSSGPSGAMEAAPASVERTLAGSGRPLEPALRHDMERRFGHDFFDVRVHSDSEASSRRATSTRRPIRPATTLCSRPENSAPGTHEGRRLLAHELTHVVQQTGSVVRRAPDAKALKEFDERAKKLRENAVYKKQKGNEKTLVAEILAIIRKRDDPLDQLAKLEQCSTRPKQTRRNRRRPSPLRSRRPLPLTRRGLRSRKQAPASATRRRLWRQVAQVQEEKGCDGSLYKIDARDVTDIALIVQVHLTAQEEEQGEHRGDRQHQDAGGCHREAHRDLGL